MAPTTLSASRWPPSPRLSSLDTEGISLSAISSAGSLENIKLLRDNQAQFGLVQGIFAAWAWNGDGPIRTPQTWLRTIGAMWTNVEHFALRRDLTSDGSIRDLNQLDGHRFVLGARNSGPNVPVTTSFEIWASTTRTESVLPTWGTAPRRTRFRTG